jgi:hypothetical protein
MKSAVVGIGGFGFIAVEVRVNFGDDLIFFE